MIDHVQFQQWVPFPLEQVFLFFADPENLPRIMPPSSRTRIDALKLVSPKSDASTTDGSPARGESGVPARLDGRDARPSTLAGVGSEIVTSFRILPSLPFRAQWIAQITEFEWNRYFADIQTRGPFKSWHHLHEFEVHMRNGVNGTVLRDRIEYDVGFGLLGVAAQKIFVRRRMGQTFGHRHTVLEELLRDPEGVFSR
jgi:ligand-binding SRPBCC domain-containing protein